MSLPPHVRRDALAVEVAPKWQLNIEDAKLFLMAYCACFMAVSTWIS
jgi:hypothetical protein